MLGLEPGASDEAIDAAHAALLATTDDASRRARLAAAHAMLKSPRARARERLFGPAPLDDLAELTDVLRALPRRPAGSVLWLEAIKAG
jgi:hypothetical protein